MIATGTRLSRASLGLLGALAWAAPGDACAQTPYLVGPPNEYLETHPMGPVRHYTDADRSCLGGFNAQTPYALNTCMRRGGGGFTITRRIETGASAPTAPLARAIDLPDALAACWAPPSEASERQITVRVAFAADGRIVGHPKITYVAASDAQAKADLSRALLAALGRCAPLRFTASFGRSIAGRPFAIRFILPGENGR